MAGSLAWCLMLLLCKPVICRITGPAQLTYFVGNNAHFRWKTDNNVTLLSARWGIKKDNIAEPQFINVDMRSSKVNLNTDLEPNLMKRLSFDGDLKKGLAWFTLKNVTVNDSNTYIAFISDDITRVLPFTVVLSVKKRKEEDEQSEVSTKNTREKQVTTTQVPQPVKTTTKETEANTPKEPGFPTVMQDTVLVSVLVSFAVLIPVLMSFIFMTDCLFKKQHLCMRKSDIKSASETKPLEAKV